ncbi:hypothetical protein BFS06_11555 [Clostridium perfringens]|uniref:Uncharacterized protein n=1 Tax=Clostridium perfringens TaxID=1502 RepID=A0A140GS19_CLOPF|nr:hypothetical protein [Clostridium perfringens]AMN31328.1 hypothetical protein JFP838_pA0412 [Clostridium perfringens]TBX14850.1 hypothetical protein BFS06_11555 [Clostridium perfringens]
MIDNKNKKDMLTRGYNFLENNSGRNKKYLINKLILDFEISEKEAKDFYYEWKCKFLNSERCIPKEDNKFNNNLSRKKKSREKFVFKRKLDLKKEGVMIFA